MEKTIEVKGKRVFWTDAKGVTHLCDGGDGPGTVGLILWTVCEVDVPANAAFTQKFSEPAITCEKCKAKETRP